MKSVTIDRTNHLPALTFIGLKSRPQGNGGKKNRSGYAEEHKQANLDNATFNMIKQLAENPAVVAELAEQGQAIDMNEVEKSIGGVSENLGIPTDDAGSIQNELS